MKLLLEKKIVHKREEELPITVRDRRTLEGHSTEEPGVTGMAKLCISNKGFMVLSHSLVLHKGDLKSPDAKRLCRQ